MAEEPTPQDQQSAPDPDPVMDPDAGAVADAGADADSGAEPGAPDDLREAEDAIAAVEDAAAAVEQATAEAPSDGTILPDFGGNGTSPGGASTGINLLGDVALRVKIELGRTRMYVEDVLRLNTDSVIELDKAAGDPVDIFVNDRRIARGEVLVLNENFCVRVSEIIENRAAEE